MRASRALEEMMVRRSDQVRRWNSESGVERTWRSVAVRGKGELVVVVVVVRSVEGEGELVMVGREEWYL